MKSQSQAYKFALIAVFLWSTVATAFKISLEYLSAIELVFYASIFSSIVLFLILYFQKKLTLIKIHFSENFKLIFLSALINPFIYYLILFKAYDLLPAQEAQAINYTWALMLTFLSVIFLKQKLVINDIIAGIICYFGVLVIATKGEPFSLSFSNLDGVILALASTLLWSMYWIINTKNESDPIVGVFSSFIVSLPMIFIYLVLTEELVFPSWQGLVAASYVGLFEMGITFVFWLYAMKKAVSTSKIANLIFISPFLSLVFIYFILSEKIFISTVVGLGLIIFGLIIQQLKSKKTIQK